MTSRSANLAQYGCLAIVTILLSCLVSSLDYRLFHVLAELLVIVISLLASMLMLGSLRHGGRPSFGFIGSGLMGSAILAFFHLVSDPNLAIMSSADANASILLLIASRAVLAASIACGLLMSSRRPLLLTVLAWVAMTLAVAKAAVAWSGFLLLYDHGRYTPLRYFCGTILLALFGLAYHLLCTRRTATAIVRAMKSAVLLMAAAEICSLMGPQKLVDIVSHVISSAAFLVVCLGVAVRFITEQADTVFSELQAKEQAHAALLRRLVTLQEEERIRLSRELHDDVGQTLTCLSVALNKVDRLGDPQLGTELRELATMALSSTRRICRSLRSAVLDDLGLVPALRRLLVDVAAAADIAQDFLVTGDVDLKVEQHVATAVYRVVQEGLSNVVRHSRAKRVSLTVAMGAEQLTVILDDDGCGFDDRKPTQGLGLIGMMERMSQVGGELRLESSPGQGTSLHIRTPYGGVAQ